MTDQYKIYIEKYDFTKIGLFLSFLNGIEIEVLYYFILCWKYWGVLII